MEREITRPVTVGQLLKEQRNKLKLQLAVGKGALHRAITHSEVNRPGLSLAGHLEHFRSERVQIIGRGEQAYCLKADPRQLFSNLSRMLAHADLPCLVLTRGLNSPATLSKACRRFNVPLLRSRLDTAAFVGELTAYLEDRLAPMTRIHGVLVDVYGLGVLILGESGIGKSECALELLKRGHILVADDVVEVQQRRGGVLLGNCPARLRHFMEVRGLGILDAKLLFGIGSILNQAQVELVVRLDLWRESTTTSYERAGIDLKTTKVLGVELPTVSIPVSPGRNLAILIEVAALNQRLRSQGIFSARRFNHRLIDTMQRAGRL